MDTRIVENSETPRLIRTHADDNVAIVVNDFSLPAGARLASGLALRERVPQGHKVALVDIAEGEAVRRYNVVIGYAAQPLPAGSWVNEERLVMPSPPALQGLPIATDNAPLTPLEGYTFEGYRNPDGSVGTRNLLAITTTVQCVSGVVEHAVRQIREELLPKYRNVDDVVGLEHIYGCGVAIEAPGAEIPIRTLRNISFNPNFGGGTMVVSLGCPASELIVGMQCGGSDAFSGVTANPAVGFASDLLVRAGATVMFSENTEVRDGVAQLTARAANAAVARR
jgi:galactarate dehydratase